MDHTTADELAGARPLGLILNRFSVFSRGVHFGFSLATYGACDVARDDGNRR
jgi:hypothetical protein